MQFTPIQNPIIQARDLAVGIHARAGSADRAGKLPAEDVRDLCESGYLAMPVLKRFGGPELPLREIIAAHLELAQGSASTGIVAAMTLQTMGHARETEPWAEDHFAHISQIVLDGGLINSAASEPRMGSPSRGAVFSSTATRDGDEWVLDGQKTWITGGQHLTHLLIKLEVEDAPGTLLVPADTPGLRWETTWGDALSLRASDSHDLYLEGARVPGWALIQHGKLDSPHPNAWFPMLLGATYLACGLAARRAVIQYALERVPSALGEPIATLPKIQRQIGEMDLVLQAAQALLLDVAGVWDNHPTERESLYPRIAAAKHFAVESAANATEIALKIAGGRAITPSLPLERYFRDARAGAMQPPSGDTALETIGQGAIAVYEASR